MLAKIDLEEVKKYNTTLKGYQEQAAKLKAEIDYMNKEIETLCAELTQELGQEVTLANIEQCYEEQVNNINSALQSGNAVLAKIASEGQNAAQQASVYVQAQASVQPQPVQPQPVQPVQTQPVQTQPVQTQPVQTQPVQPQPVQEQKLFSPENQPQVVFDGATVSSPVAGSVFGTNVQNQSTVNNGATVTDGMVLPPLFGA